MSEANEPVIMHLLVENEKGTIKSNGVHPSQYDGTKTFGVACKIDAPLPKYATGSVAAVSCPNCIESPFYEQAKKEQEPGTDIDRAARAKMRAIGVKHSGIPVEKTSSLIPQ